MPKLNTEQRNVLKSRIHDAVGYNARDRAVTRATLPDTIFIKRARSLVKRFEAMNGRREDAVVKAFRKAEREAEQALAFATPAEALAMLAALEKRFAPKAKAKGHARG